MNEVVKVEIPLDPEAARALQSPARREAVGRYLSFLLKEGHIPDLLAKLIAEAKQEARASGLTDEAIDAEIEAWRAEGQA